MRMAELSATTGVPVATVKMYLRERLLPPGEKTGPNQSDYGDEHVTRVRMVQALMRVGGISLATAREVLAAIDSDMSLHDAFGVAQRAATRPVDSGSVSEAALDRIDRVLAQWNHHPDSVGRLAAAQAVEAFEASGQVQTDAWLHRYAAAALEIAEADLDVIDAREGRDAKAETVVIGTVLGDALFAGLRRAAQEHVSSLRYSTPPHSDSQEH